jgi:hypothetical protein
VNADRLTRLATPVVTTVFAVVVAPSAISMRAPLTLYSVATGVQFINTADDRARGAVNNPFDITLNRLTPPSDYAGQGPFPGDVAVYSLDLYRRPIPKGSAGSAVYTCYFNYARYAFCQAYYTLKGFGTVVASGPVNFNTKGFTLVVTGGTKKYLGARGEVIVIPTTGNAQRVHFGLIK